MLMQCLNIQKLSKRAPAKKAVAKPAEKAVVAKEEKPVVAAKPATKKAPVKKNKK